MSESERSALVQFGFTFFLGMLCGIALYRIVAWVLGV